MSTMAATAAPSGTGVEQFTTGLGGSSPTSAPSSDTGSGASVVAIGLGQNYGLGLVFAGVFAGFAILL